MVNAKIVKLLRTFSKTEIFKFRDFFRSPYFNKNGKVILLGEAILSFYPGFDSPDFTEKNIFKMMFNNEEFDYFKIKNFISDLYQLTVLFLKTRTVEKKEYENEIDLLNELHERKLDIIYNQRERKVSEHLGNSLIKDEEYYYLRHRLGKINTSHYKFEKSGYLFDQIQNEFDTFLDYSLIGLLRLYSKMLHNKNHGNINFNMEMFENIREYIKDKNFEKNPSCQIYKQIISLELSREEKDYRDLLRMKEKFRDNLPDEDIYYILLIANSFTVYRLRLGDETYYRERFLVYKEIIDRNFTPDNYMLFVNFISYFTSACMVGEFAWAEDFMKRFRGGITPDAERSNTINYCKGFMAYRLKDYDKALEFFAKTNFKLYLTKVMVKSYSLRIFYEQDMHEQTLSAIDSFRHYLKAETLMTEDQKLAHYEFLKHVTELSNLKLEGPQKNDDENLFMLRVQIKSMSSNPLGAKNWLTEKAEELNVLKNKGA